MRDRVGIVAVTVGEPAELAKAKSAAGLRFPVVADVDGELMDLFGVRHAGGHPLTGGDLPRSASVLVTSEGEVVWKAVADNYRVRPGPGAARSAARYFFEERKAFPVRVGEPLMDADGR